MSHRCQRVRRPRRLFLGLSLSLLLGAQAAAAQTQPEKKPVFLVADVVVGEGVPLEKEAARDVLATRFGRLKDKLEVRSMAEARASIDNAAMAQLMGSTDDADLARIENYMQVDRIVLGRVTQVAGVVDLQVKVFNVKEGVTEVAFARRLGKSADRSMMLTMLDTLADALLAWTIENYTDGSMSAAATAMKAKKLGGAKKPEEVASSSSTFGASGITGFGLAGFGAGVTAAAVINAANNGVVSNTDVGLGVGGLSGLAVGLTLVIIDAATE